MNQRLIVEQANEAIFQRLLKQKFYGCPNYVTCEIGGAVVFVEPSRHRSGIPIDATCTRYVITNLAQEWSIVARSVWLGGRLHKPAAVHTRIDGYSALGECAANGETVEAVNRWLVELVL